MTKSSLQNSPSETRTQSKRSMKAIQVARAGGDFELIEKPIPNPGRDEVRIKVEACGMCHSDQIVKEGYWPGIQYPRVPGHEVIGRIDEVGSEVKGWKKGERVGVGWHGGHCFRCEPCRHGDFINCQNARITGLSYDGGHAEYMVAPEYALARVPESLNPIEAAPLLCAGITTYNALRNSGARGGDLVAIQGIGGLGHLAIQFSNKLGFKTVAISSGADKEPLAKKLGADFYIDGSVKNPAEELTKMGGACVILATAPNSKLMSEIIGGLGVNGKLMIVGASAEPMSISPLALIGGKKSIQGWASGHARDSEDTLNFSALRGVVSQNEIFPIEKFNEAYARMLANKVRFRVVIKM